MTALCWAFDKVFGPIGDRVFLAMHADDPKHYFACSVPDCDLVLKGPTWWLDVIGCPRCRAGSLVDYGPVER